MTLQRPGVRNPPDLPPCGRVAQLVEHSLDKRVVTGSSPVATTIFVPQGKASVSCGGGTGRGVAAMTLVDRSHGGREARRGGFDTLADQPDVARSGSSMRKFV